MIITIARQCGSGGHEIGKELTSRLGLELYDRKKLEDNAEKAAENAADNELYETLITKMTVEIPCKCVKIIFKPSIKRLNSPPDAVFANGFGSSPWFMLIKNST